MVLLWDVTGIPCEMLDETNINTTKPPVYGVIGKPVLLDCTPPGSQDFTFSWKRSSRFINESMILSNGTLQIANYSVQSDGLYSCLVSNECNMNTPIANINLKTAGELWCDMCSLSPF